MPQSIPESFAAKEAIARDTVDRPLLGRAATLADVGNAAAVVASDRAAVMTDTSIDITRGTEWAEVSERRELTLSSDVDSYLWSELHTPHPLAASDLATSRH